MTTTSQLDEQWPSCEVDVSNCVINARLTVHLLLCVVRQTDSVCTL